jgi:heme-degrading monooxygenase HmoA
MIVTVFRSRLRPGVRDEYIAMVEKIAKIAASMPGYISHKGFFADDGERVTIVEFEHEEGLRAWRTNPEHRAARMLARTKYYTEYHVQVCRLDRESKFKAQDAVIDAIKDTAAAHARPPHGYGAAQR